MGPSFTAYEWVAWRAKDVKTGVYELSVVAATLSADAKITVEIGDQSITAALPASGGWDSFSNTSLGKVEIKQTGNLDVKVRATDPATWRAVNLNSVRLTLTK